MRTTEQPTHVLTSRFSPGDVTATLLVAAAVVISVLWFTDVGLTSWSTRLVAGVVLALGYLGCMSTRSRMAQVYGAQGQHRAPMAYVVVSSLLGAAALISGAVALLWGAQAMLAVLLVATVALWALATARHLTSTS